MLVLSRGISETIVIEDPPITIKVIRITGEKVKIGIEASRSIVIHRGEVAAERVAVKTSGPPVVPCVKIGERLPGEDADCPPNDLGQWGNV